MLALVYCLTYVLAYAYASAHSHIMTAGHSMSVVCRKVLCHWMPHAIQCMRGGSIVPTPFSRLQICLVNCLDNGGKFYMHIVLVVATVT